MFDGKVTWSYSKVALVMIDLFYIYVMGDLFIYIVVHIKFTTFWKQMS